MSAAPLDCDVLIVGGGLVGTALANALGQIPVSTVMVEARDPSVFEQPNFDGRVTALARGSRRILEQLGLWPAIGASAEAIRFIHIGEQGRFGAARIDADEEGVEALGYTVENRVLGEALWRGLDAAPAFECLAPATLEEFRVTRDGVVARVAEGGVERRIEAKLLIAADGSRSSVRDALGVRARHDDYGQHAIVVNCTTEAPLRGRAFERFTRHGPLAVLPLTGGRAAVVWTLADAEAERARALDDGAFRDELQRAFGHRLGRFERIGRRAAYPLLRVLSTELGRERTLLIGNAAVSLHPVAAQGFNLALRDVATIAELIADDAAGGGASPDPGAAALLDAYARWRAADQRKVAGFTHGLVRLFGMPAPGLGAVRGLGLVAFDLLPGAKAELARHTMGLAGRLPRLARGMPLVDARG